MTIELRAVSDADIKRIFEWRNDPGVRAGSFQTAEISWEEHVTYWERRLRNKKDYSYIIVSEGTNSGLVRLDNKDGAYEVHVLIAPEQRGKGFGTTAIAETKKIAALMKIKKLTARVKPGNTASQKIFERNGFEKVEENKEFVKYEYREMPTNIIFYGGRQAGAICLLTILARGENVALVIPQDDIVEGIAKEMKLAIFKPKSINSEESEQRLKALNSDLLVCAHGRQIVKGNILSIPKKGCINAHPCLYKYKGAHPIERLLADKETKASVGIHEMTEQVDGGKTIEEIFIDVGDCKTVIEVYNKLYLVYSMAINRALDKIKEKK